MVLLHFLRSNCMQYRFKIAAVKIRNFSSIAVGNEAKSLKEVENSDLISEENYGHIPVMSKEVLEALHPKDGQTLMDMTFGAGGHSTQLLNAASIKLICLDRDPVAYEKAVEFAELHEGSVTPVLGRFSQMKEVLAKAGIKKNSIDGILIDAGVSSMQLDCASRGFSISKDGPLDMRMDGDIYPDQPTAADVVNTLDFPSLAKIFKVYGEERYSRKIAQALIDARYMLKTINTTNELATLIKSILEDVQRFDMLQRPTHCATKVFQALRIFVNNELNELNYGMHMAYEFLKPGGRLVALTFHSLEDRIVKRHILGIDMDEPVNQSIHQKQHNATVCYSIEDINDIYSNKWIPLYKHIVKPSEEETKSNPRSRSAKLRAAVKNKET